MKKSLQLIVAGCVCFSSAYGLASNVVDLKTPFSVDEVSWVKEKGNSTVSGSAYITLEDGKEKGCARFNIELLPVGGYSNERIYKIYGNNIAGQILLSQNPPKFNPDVKEYHELLIATNCDDDHKFRFNNVPKGDYYLIAFIMWDEEKDGTTKKLGGAVMKKIHVKDSEVIESQLATSGRL